MKTILLALLVCGSAMAGETNKPPVATNTIQLTKNQMEWVKLYDQRLKLIQAKNAEQSKGEKLQKIEDGKSSLGIGSQELRPDNERHFNKSLDRSHYWKRNPPEIIENKKRVSDLSKSIIATELAMRQIELKDPSAKRVNWEKK